MPLSASLTPIATRRAGVEPKLWDFLAVVLVLGFILFLAQTSASLVEPLSELKIAPVSLDPGNLPGYAARTTLRMLAALALSLVFPLTSRTLGRKNQRSEALLVPLLE